MATKHNFYQKLVRASGLALLTLWGATLLGWPGHLILAQPAYQVDSPAALALAVTTLPSETPSPQPTDIPTPTATLLPTETTPSPPIDASSLAPTATPLPEEMPLSLLPVAQVHLAPANAQVFTADIGTTEVQVEAVSGLYGVDFRLTFDPGIVTVLDADPDRSGVQIAVGSLFDGQVFFVARNQVDNTAGLIEFAVSQRHPALPISGSGTLAAITWQGLDEGTAALTLAEVILSNQEGQPINHDTQNSAIEVMPETDEPVYGQVLLQGRIDHSGTGIVVTEETCSALVQTIEVSATDEPVIETDADGYFEITPLDGQTYGCLRAVQHGYLTGQKESPQGNLGAITLLGGDVTVDDQVDIFDLAFIGSRYGNHDSMADINGDGNINIFDLVMAAANFGQHGPITEWQ